MEDELITRHRLSFAEKCTEWFKVLQEHSRLILLPQADLDKIRDFYLVGLLILRKKLPFSSNGNASIRL